MRRTPAGLSIAALLVSTLVLHGAGAMMADAAGVVAGRLRSDRGRRLQRNCRRPYSRGRGCDRAAGRCCLSRGGWRADNGCITIRDLLTHYSGLKPDLDLPRRWSGYDTAMAMLVAERPQHRPRTRYVYSDENFEVLGELVRRVSGTTLDEYCEREIFAPLGMRDTRFRPDASRIERIAPTGRSRLDAVGTARVNDPTAQRMGGVAGHAGLSSTAADLATFARMLLEGGAGEDVRILSPSSVASMTGRASPPDGAHERGLGWDLAPAFLAGQAPQSYGHTGYTGTMLWIDPASRTYVIVLTNRTYPDGRGDAQPLRKAVLAHVSAVLTTGPAAESVQSR